MPIHKKLCIGVKQGGAGGQHTRVRGLRLTTILQ